MYYAPNYPRVIYSIWILDHMALKLTLTAIVMGGRSFTNNSILGPSAHRPGDEQVAAAMAPHSHSEGLLYLLWLVWTGCLQVVFTTWLVWCVFLVLPAEGVTLEKKFITANWNYQRSVETPVWYGAENADIQQNADIGRKRRGQQHYDPWMPSDTLAPCAATCRVRRRAMWLALSLQQYVPGHRGTNPGWTKVCILLWADSVTAADGMFTRYPRENITAYWKGESVKQDASQPALTISMQKKSHALRTTSHASFPVGLKASELESSFLTKLLETDRNSFLMCMIWLHRTLLNSHVRHLSKTTHNFRKSGSIFCWILTNWGAMNMQLRAMKRFLT